MGGVVAKGNNNDELIDNLVEAKYIESDEIENVFRAVDRGDFYPGEYLEDAYKDLAMKNGNLHMSAVSIYCKVMENFELQEGLSFLNVGSGTGYLSTLVGLIIGAKGINHGIDLHEDVLEYAKKKVKEFILFSNGFYSTSSFCEPKFVLGNIESLDFGFHYYDRIYCGARIMKSETRDNLLSILSTDNGIMIYPYGEMLMKCKRTSMTEYEETALMHVQFSDLIGKDPTNMTTIRIYTQPKSLQNLCRSTILSAITKDRLNSLDSLPLPNVLIRYLKYYRDPTCPKPVRETKVRPEPSGEINFHIITIR